MPVPVNFDDLIKRVVTTQGTTTDTKVKEQLLSISKDMRDFAQEREDERNKLQTTINQQQTTVAQLQTSIGTLRQTNAEQALEIEGLKKRLGGPQPSSSATPLNLAQSFKGVIDAIQAEAHQTPGVATTIKSMDLEVKGLVQVQEDKSTLLVLPGAGSSIDANALSTLRVSFGAIPVVAPAVPLAVPDAPPAAPPVVRTRTTKSAPTQKARRERKKILRVRPTARST
jgi:hypothetical protein